MNRLAAESSPYLLQHQDNPVDWYPWGAEALLKARAEDKPIFLSIGYAACHWCHVMEHESFENRQIADFLNQNFVSIKVDREERPDLDQIYMQAVMAMNGHGGWPLSAFLTPDQDFFFGGTYWPPTSTHQMPGFDRVLASVLDAYHNKREEVVAQSRQITEMLNQSMAEQGGNVVFDPALFQAAAQGLYHRFDASFGGFGSAPKFPHPMDLSLLLHLYEYQQGRLAGGWDKPAAAELLEMVEVSLQRMAGGGIFDHLAGGFARYSVDARWLVPHFEKMLYDNALLAGVYAHASRVTGNEFYADICEQTLDYLLQYMRDPGGAFYSTEDADSEGEEGKFYVWSMDEVLQILGEDQGRLFCRLYDVTTSGNFEGHNILNLPRTISQFAAEQQLDETQLQSEMQAARQQMLRVRDQRVRPGLDDKVLTSWNGLAIDALSQAAVLLQRDSYAQAAAQAADFIWDHLRQSDGRLLRVWRNGSPRLSAYLDDYACLINALVSLYRVAFDQQWLTRAGQLADLMVTHFYDDTTQAFFFTANDHEKLIARTHEFQDSAVPSGNAMAATALIRLGQLTGQRQLMETGFAAASAAMPLLKRAANAGSQSLIAAQQFLHYPELCVLVCGGDPRDNQQATEYLQRTLPLAIPLVVAPPAATQRDGPLARMLAGKSAVDGQATLFVCRDFECQRPLVGLQEIETVGESIARG